MEDFSDIEKHIIDIESDKLTKAFEDQLLKFTKECYDEDVDFEIMVNAMINSLIKLNFNIIASSVPDEMVPRVYAVVRDTLAKNIAEYLITAALSTDKATMQ